LTRKPVPKKLTCVCGFETDDWEEAHAHMRKYPSHSYRIWVSPDQQYEFTNSERFGDSSG
jgi:hypothetical protein